jgi:uncharacterized alpha-E superfamily protein
MLSRVAESLFWIGRYLERADGTARILDVHLRVAFEDSSADEEAAYRYLLYIMGTPAPDDAPIEAAAVMKTLATDKKNPISIAYSLTLARENGRRAREIISTELWECLNTISQQVPKKVAPDKLHELFHWASQQAAMAAGIADTTMLRDDAYQFFELGRALERADMTARLLATRVATPDWTTLLRSCGAYEACLRTYHGMPSVSNAAEFLLMDKFFPRSVMWSFERALKCLRALDPAPEREAASSNTARRILVRAVSSLEYRSIEEIVEDLPQRMDSIQISINEASEAVRQKYFPTDAIPTWVGEQT